MGGGGGASNGKQYSREIPQARRDEYLAISACKNFWVGASSLHHDHR